MALNTAQIFPKAGVLALVQITAASPTPTDVLTSETDGRVVYGFQLSVPGNAVRNVITVSLYDGTNSRDVDWIPVPDVTYDPEADPMVMPWSQFYSPRWMQAINLETGGVTGFVLPNTCKVQMRIQYNDTLVVAPIAASLNGA